MKLNELLLARKVIVSKSQTQVPARLAYKMMKFIKGTEDEENFYNEKLRAIIEEYGARDKEGKLEGESGGVKIRPDALSACKSAIKELDEKSNIVAAEKCCCVVVAGKVEKV